MIILLINWSIEESQKSDASFAKCAGTGHETLPLPFNVAFVYKNSSKLHQSGTVKLLKPPLIFITSLPSVEIIAGTVVVSPKYLNGNIIE